MNTIKRTPSVAPFALWAALSLLPAVPSTDAATLEVDDDGTTAHQTIQSAIDAAVPGEDDVLVHCGHYPENIVMQNGVNVSGVDADCVTIDGGGLDSTVTMIDIDAGTVLEGFTITGGTAALGGGIYIEAGSPTITRNVIKGNTAENVGGFSGYGGGIMVTAPPTDAPVAPVIRGNVIRGNVAEKFGGGISIDTDDGTQIINNLIEGNRAASGGGGIDTYQSFPTILNNTIVRNCVPDAMTTPCAQGGGGVSITNSGVVKFANNVIAWNEAAAGGGGVDLATSDAEFQSNDLFANQSPERDPNFFADSSSTPTRSPVGSNGNVSVDPLFVDELSDTVHSYQPRSDSPLVDAGGDSLVTPPDDDIKGVPRPVDGDADGTARGDIGARENEGVTGLLFDTATDLSWHASIAGGAAFNLYRGDLETLKTQGIYTQDPATVPGAARQCGLLAPSASDADLPAAGQTFFYIAVIDNLVEGTLGFDSTPAMRPYTDPNRCP